MEAAAAAFGRAASYHIAQQAATFQTIQHSTLPRAHLVVLRLLLFQLPSGSSGHALCAHSLSVVLALLKVNKPA
jgi:hypothetical protein